MKTKPKIMIHLDNGWKWETQKWWYDAVLGAGLSAGDYDIQVSHLHLHIQPPHSTRS
jgi:arabinogalactan endo-1,4-beta-galactosidase